MNDVYETTKDAGIYVATYAPGDGVTRYRFFLTPEDYNQSSRELYCARGRKEALVWLSGYATGRNGR